ncbi:hypothetical protein EJ110_NYTH51279 [Nymphaea thermarum]|nr:hypothetical protein EJ110_NYTH51279 [Nymphaea thermarum]
MNQVPSDFLGQILRCAGLTLLQMKESFRSMGCSIEISDLVESNLQQILFHDPSKRRTRQFGNLGHPRSSCCLYMACENRLAATHDRLRHLGFQLPSSCPLCGRQGEDSLHLFFHCRFAANSWLKIVQKFNRKRLPRANIVREFKKMQMGEMYLIIDLIILDSLNWSGKEIQT